MSNIHALPPLPNDVALRIADLAGIPDKERHSFCDLLSGTVERVWNRARPESEKAGPELIRAAEAARILREAFGSLNKEDREWVKRLLAQHPRYRDAEAGEPLVVLREKILWLVDLFSTAIGKSPVGDAQPDRRGRRRGTVKNVIFQDFVFDLLHNAGACGGDFTFDRPYETGSLLDAIKILSPHLPKGMVPKPLSKAMSTIQRIETKYRELLPHIEG